MRYLFCAITIISTLRFIPLMAAEVPVKDSSSEAFSIGKSSIVLEKHGKNIPLFIYRPQAFKQGPMILVLHGMDRNAGEYRDRAVVLGDRFKALIVAPQFDAAQFPDEAYQQGGVTRKGKVVPSDQWTFRFFAEIIEEARLREGRPDMPCYIIGHSAGGQILTRMAAFQPDGVSRIIAANPGALVFPTRDMPFPYGFGDLPRELSSDQAIRRYLAAPMTLFLGTADTESKNLDDSKEAMLQGATRIERGRACFEAAQKLAAKKGWEFNWRKVEAEGVGHQSARLFAHENAKEAIFGADNAPAQ